ncbi:hypothetical protein [Microbacterium sp.]|uniref:hypothetical protein n=1 Tax=Microbacterium sp. TaxID=51671 RepID=UPI0037354447
MKRPAPKPDNFDELTRTWNNPAAFARELTRYYEQISTDKPADITEPLWTREIDA